MSTFDWVIVAAYVLFSLAIGLLASRKVRTMSDYLVAGRAVKFYLGVASLTGTEMGVISVMGLAELGYTQGFTACTLHQRCIAHVDGRERIELDLKMYLEADDPHDAVHVEGDPPLDLLLRGGVAGDIATVAALVNIVPRLLQAAPGLRLITDLAVPAWTGAKQE